VICHALSILGLSKNQCFIIIIIIINCNWVITQWQWLFYMYTNWRGGGKVTRKFKSGGLRERHVVATWKLGEPSQHLLVDTGKPSKTCVKVAGHRNFRILTSSQQSGNTHSTTNTYKVQ